MKRSRAEAEQDEPDDNNYHQGSSSPPSDNQSCPELRYLDGLPARKVTGLDYSEYASDNSNSNSNKGIEMKCSLPGHRETLSFKTYDEYQSHYQKDHTNRCLDCRKNFPSPHLLGVHIEECHDSFVAVKREKGEHTYSCFVEGCERKCRTPQKRRLHLIDKHMYPKNYFYAVTQTGIDGRRSLLVESHQRRRSSTTGNFNSSTAKESRHRSSQMEATATRPPTKLTEKSKHVEAEPSTTGDDKAAVDSESRADTEMEDLTGAMSALQFVPRGVKFGRGGGKAGFSKR